MANTAFVDTREVDALLKRLGRPRALRALARSLNRGITATRTKASKIIRRDVALRARDVNKAIDVKRSGLTKPEASLTISGRPVPVDKFGKPNQTRRGVSVRILKSSGRKVIKGAFLAPVRSDTFAFLRGEPGDGKSRRKPVPRRGPAPHFSQLPIDRIFSLSVAKALSRRRINLDEALKAGQEQVVRTMQQEVRNAVRKGLAR